MDQKRIQITEVGPRDGFQNVKKFIATQDKLKIIDKLYQAGVRTMEVTSFVSSRAIGQMADSSEVAKYVIARYPDLQPIALVPNLRGALNARDAGIREVACVISASEAHNKANVNRTVAQSLEGLKTIRENLPELRVHLDVATAFGCPFVGKTPVGDVMDLVVRAAELGIQDITLCDTVGVANPMQVQALVSVLRMKFPEMKTALHFHNTRAMGLANVFAAVQLGVDRFETSVGGLGGCPFAPGTDGNIATEDTVHMLREMGFDTGIDSEKLLDAVACTAECVDAPLSGKMLAVHNSTCRNKPGTAHPGAARARG